MYDLPSAETDHFVASHGMMSPFGVTRTSESYIAYMRCRSTNRPDSIGSMLLMSEFIAKVTLPPYAAFAPPAEEPDGPPLVVPVHAARRIARAANSASAREIVRAMHTPPDLPQVCWRIRPGLARGSGFRGMTKGRAVGPPLV